MTRTVGIVSMAAGMLVAGCSAPPYDYLQSTNAVVAQRIDLWRAGDEIETNDLVHLQVRDGLKTRYRVLGGPNPAGGAVHLKMKNPQVAFMVAGGWIYMSGNWPSGTTLRVSAAAEGTRMILQEQSNIHRVFFLGDWPKRIRVVLDGDTEHPKYMTKPRTYIEVGPGDDHLPDPVPIAKAPEEIQNFVAYVEDLVGITD